MLMLLLLLLLFLQSTTYKASTAYDISLLNAFCFL